MSTQRRSRALRICLPFVLLLAKPGESQRAASWRVVTPSYAPPASLLVPATSTDGRRWQSQPCRLVSVTSTGEALVAVGACGLTATSADGENWSQRWIAGGPNLTTVTWTGRELVAGGSRGAILRSLDGREWCSSTTNLTADVNRLVWDGARFVAVLGDGAVSSSSDGVDWSVPQLGQKGFLDVATNGRDTIVVG